MKKLGFLLLILAAQIVCKTAPLLAQDGNNSQAIVNIIKTFYESDVKGDLDSAANQLSPNFSIVVNGERLDYDQHLVFMKKMQEQRAGRFLDCSIYNIKMTKFDISGNNAVAEVDYDWHGVDRETSQDVFVHKRRSVSLAKENGAWKIISFGVLPSTKE